MALILGMSSAKMLPSIGIQSEVYDLITAIQPLNSNIPERET